MAETAATTARLAAGAPAPRAGSVAVRRGAYYLLLTGVVGGAYLAAAVLFTVLQAREVTDSRAFPVFFTLAVLVLFNPLRTAGGTNALVARLRQPTPADRAARVRTIRAPTLVITGDTDRLVPLETARAYHALIAGSELLVLAHTGHLPQEEQPERVVAEITRWVQASAARD